MTILKIKDKVGLGKLVIEASTNAELRRRLIENANSVLEEFVDIPNGHIIKAVEQAENMTQMMLPLAEDLHFGEREAKSFTYPDEYDSGSPNYIDPTREPQKAFEFSVGDYILKSCR